MKKLLVVLMAVALAMVVSGCSSTTVRPSKPFDANQANNALSQTGNNTISGTAMIITGGPEIGGFITTCSGTGVYLLPVTEASSDIMQQAFGNTIQGHFHLNGAINKLHLEEAQNVLDVSRKETCDPDGRFTYNNVKDGDYYLMARIVWRQNVFGAQGEYLMQRVHVSGGQKFEVKLVPEEKTLATEQGLI